MNYRTDKYGNELSILGFGCMRFPSRAGIIDMAETEREIMTAFKNGINYYDTAYIYPGSEAAIGEIFEKNGIRDQVKIMVGGAPLTDAFAKKIGADSYTPDAATAADAAVGFCGQ